MGQSALPPGIRLTIHSSLERQKRFVIDSVLEALLNLVKNATEALVEGGVITIGLSQDESSGALILDVSDNGPGVAPDVEARLSNRFTVLKAQKAVVLDLLPPRISSCVPVFIHYHRGEPRGSTLG